MAPRNSLTPLDELESHLRTIEARPRAHMVDAERRRTIAARDVQVADTRLADAQRTLAALRMDAVDAIAEGREPDDKALARARAQVTQLTEDRDLRLAVLVRAESDVRDRVVSEAAVYEAELTPIFEALLERLDHQAAEVVRLEGVLAQAHRVAAAVLPTERPRLQQGYGGLISSQGYQRWQQRAAGAGLLNAPPRPETEPPR